MKTEDRANYLTSSSIIDFHAPAVSALAKSLTSATENETIKRCFEFVRDEIRHSGDHELNPVTCAASEVLSSGTGYCYAKSHLLCALLRANDIPAGMCYQRLMVDENATQFCLHGLNAVHIAELGWYRIDARGRRDGLMASFDPPNECLPFRVSHPLERDISRVYVDPLDQVVEVLRRFQTWHEVASNLPDVANAEDQGPLET